MTNQEVPQPTGIKYGSKQPKEEEEVDGAIYFSFPQNRLNSNAKRLTEISMEGFQRGFGFASKSRESMSVSSWLSYDWLSFLEKLKAVLICPNPFLPSQGQTESHCEAQTSISGWSNKANGP